MKTISKIILAILLVSFMTVACDDMNSIIQADLDKGETIYPGRPGYYKPRDDVFPGIGKAWIHWALGADPRVVKTVITYTSNGETQSVEKPAPADGSRMDSLLLENLVEGYYSFSMYTVDKEGHRSISTNLYPQIVRIYGDLYLNSLSARGIDKMEMLAGGKLKITWSKAAPEVLYSLVKYRDYSTYSNGLPVTDTVFNDSTTSVLPGYKRFETFSVRSSMQVGIDDAPVEDLYAPPVVEKVLLATAPNNFTELTAERANAVTALAYPVGIESWTLQDLYYFPNLRTLDLTPGTDWLPEWTYNRSYVDKVGNTTDTAKYSSKVGNIPWSNLVSGYMPDSDIDIIRDLLKSGQLTSVKYTRNSYPKLDSILDLYSSKVTWIPAEPLPEYGIPIPTKLLVDDYSVVDRNKGNIITPDATVPAGIAAKFTGANGLNDVYKVVIHGINENKNGSNTIAFALPAGLQFGFVPNGRLEFDCYIETSLDPEYSWLKPAGISKYETWKSLRFFYSRKLSDDFPDDSPYVEADYPFGTSHRPGTFEAQPGKDQFYSFTDEELGTWKSFEVTAYNENFKSMATGHYRVIRIQFGSEDAGTPWPLPSFKVEVAPGVVADQTETLTYYIANLRWSK